MKSTSPAKLPPITVDGTCVRIPRPLLSDRTRTGATLSMDTAFIAGEIFSYSTTTRKDTDRPTCTRTYRAFSKRLGCSIATVGRAVRKLENGYIERVAQSQYKSILDESNNFIRAPYFIFNTQFKINDETRTLTPAEISIFALIYTTCDNDKRGHNKFCASNSEIARALDLHPDTVSRLKQNLYAAGLIGLNGMEHDAHGVRKSRYYVNKKLLRRNNRKTSRPEIQDDEESERITRERWYAEHRQSAELEAERNKRIALKDQEYATANKKLISIYIAEARAHDPRELQRLTAERQALERQQLQALNRLNLLPGDLEPQYHCHKCNDTGIDSNGRPCDCFDREHGKSGR